MELDQIPLWGTRRVLALALAVVTLVVFWPVLGHHFVFDDLLYITDNPRVNTGLNGGNVLWAFREFYAGNWHPLTWLSHMADVEMFGLRPAGHHAVSLLLHVANAVLLFLVLESLTNARGRSAFVAALFAIHPLHVESVAWAAERKDVLSTFFWMLTMAAYAKYVRRPGPGALGLACAALAFGLMSKPMLVTLPFVLLLLDVWPLKRLELKWRLVTEKAPLFALAFLSSVVTVLAQTHAAAIVEVERLPMRDRLENALVSAVLYLWKTIWPFDLAVYYPHPGSNVSAAALAGALLLVAGVSGAALRTIRSAPWIALGWFWFLGTLVPVIGIVQVGKQGMADRYSYVPLVGIFVLAAWGLPAVLSRLRVPRPAHIVAGLAVLACLGVVARFQVGYWKNPVALYSHALAVTSANPVMESNLGFTLMREGRSAEALAHLSRAVAEDPLYFDAALNLGVALTNAGQFQDALRHLLAAQALLPSDGRPLFGIGNLHLQQGNVGAAVASYRGAVALQPDAADFHNNLGVALMQGGQSREATDSFRTAVRLAPAMVKAQLNLAYALELAGEQRQALVHYRIALSVDPASEQARQGVERISRALR